MSEQEPNPTPGAPGGGEHELDTFEGRLSARLASAAAVAAGGGVALAGVEAAVARRRAVRRRRYGMVAAAACVAALGGGAALASRSAPPRDVVRTGAPTTTSPPAAPCILPGDFGVIGQVELTGDQMAHLIARHGERPLSPRVMEQPPTLDGDTYETLREVPELAITVEQLRQMGYDLDAADGPVWTVPPSTTTTTTAPGGPTPFETWAQVLRDAGLLTPEQEAEIAAGRGISLTVEQAQVMQEYWDGIAPDGGPVASTVPPGGEVGPPRCDVPSTLPLARNGRQVDDTAVPEGQEVWAVYLDVYPGPRTAGDVSDPETRWFAATARSAEAGYYAGIFPLHCDLGASPSWAGPLADDEVALASAAYFETEAQARVASAAIPGEERVAPVRLSCVDAADPITGWAHR